MASAKVRRRPRSDESLRPFRVGEGLPELEELRAELEDMRNVLVGHTPPPIDKGVGTLMEVASAYLGRALEIQAFLHEGEARGHTLRSSQPYKFRTGELRDFVELAKNAYEMGSRRLAQAEYEARLMQQEGRWDR